MENKIKILCSGEEALREENERHAKERELNSILRQQVRDRQAEAEIEQSKTAQDIINEVGE